MLSPTSRTLFEEALKSIKDDGIEAVGYLVDLVGGHENCEVFTTTQFEDTVGLIAQISEQLSAKPKIYEA